MGDILLLKSCEKTFEDTSGPQSTGQSSNSISSVERDFSSRGKSILGGITPEYMGWTMQADFGVLEIAFFYFCLKEGRMHRPVRVPFILSCGLCLKDSI